MVSVYISQNESRNTNHEPLAITRHTTMNETLTQAITESITVHLDSEGNTIAEELDTGYWYHPSTLTEFNVSLPTMATHVGHVMATERSKRESAWTPKRRHDWLTKEERKSNS